MAKYRMRMRVVRGAPHYDTIDAGTVEETASNAWLAERLAVSRIKIADPSAVDAYAATKRRVV